MSFCGSGPHLFPALSFFWHLLYTYSHYCSTPLSLPLPAGLWMSTQGHAAPAENDALTHLFNSGRQTADCLQGWKQNGMMMGLYAAQRGHSTLQKHSDTHVRVDVETTCAAMTILPVHVSRFWATVRVFVWRPLLSCLSISSVSAARGPSPMKMRLWCTSLCFFRFGLVTLFPSFSLVGTCQVLWIFIYSGNLMKTWMRWLCFVNTPLLLGLYSKRWETLLWSFACYQGVKLFLQSWESITHTLRALLL